MKTTSFTIEDLRVPCNSHCRYCLLACENKVNTTGFEETEAFIRRLDEEFRNTDVHFSYYMGYCMDDPCLHDYIRLSQELGYPSGDFLQLNGLKFRDLGAIANFITNLKDWGIKLVDLTFYGLREYHDRFAGRKGDFDYLVDTLRACMRLHMPVRISMPLNKENMDQAGKLYRYLHDLDARNFFIFLPHSKGRGRYLEDLRLTREDFDRLPKVIKKNFGKSPYKTEREWLEENDFEEPETRILVKVLRDDSPYLHLTGKDILKELEEKDDAFYGKMPSTKELAQIYGNRENEQLFRKRDLIIRYRQAWAKDHPEIEDTIEEYKDFSIRY